MTKLVETASFNQLSSCNKLPDCQDCNAIHDYLKSLQHFEVAERSKVHQIQTPNNNAMVEAQKRPRQVPD